MRRRESARRYTGYQGRDLGGWALRVLLTLLVIVLLLFAVALMVGQRYIVYTDDGIRLELPFFRREQAPDASVSLPVEIVK